MAQGSDGAFRALVARHVDLVYASALRQVGDRGIAEEITQNVFVALARKAPSLAGRETLAGWLYRTTLLEAKTRIRAELRRRQREQRAVDLATLRSVLGQQRAELVLKCSGGWLESQFAVSGTQPKIISVERHPNGTYNLSIQTGNSWFSTGGFDQLNQYLPEHLLPMFSDGLNQ